MEITDLDSRRLHGKLVRNDLFNKLSCEHLHRLAIILYSNPLLDLSFLVSLLCAESSVPRDKFNRCLGRLELSAP